MSQGRDVSPALNHSDIVFVAEKQKRSKAKRQRLNISQEHKQRIREKVRAEYHQYLPRASPVHRAQRRPVRWAARQRRGSIPSPQRSNSGSRYPNLDRCKSSRRR
jgi:hypothetical protein